MSLASGVEGFRHPSGFWIPNPLMSHTCKYNCTKMPFDAVRYARDIIAGFGETAPSELDMRSEGVGKLCQEAFNPGNPDYDAFERHSQSGNRYHKRCRKVRISTTLDLPVMKE